MRGFKDLRCPLCGEADNVWMRLKNVETIECLPCEGSFTIDEAVSHFSRQARAYRDLAEWLNGAPEIKE